MSCTALLACLSLAFLLQLPAPARADADARAAEDPDLTADVQRAVEAYDAGDMQKARALFESVHARAPTARTLRSLGLVAFRQARFDDAVQLLAASLESTVKPLPDELRQPAAELLEEARAKLRAAPVPDAASALAAAQLGAGEPGPAPGARTSPAPPEPAFTPTRTPAPPARGKRLKRTGYALLAIGAGALLAGGISGLIGLGRLHDMEDQCRNDPNQKCSESEAQRLEAAGKLDLLSGFALGSALLGGVSTASGGVLLLLQSGAPTERPAGHALGVRVSIPF